jgi:HAD superfamily hydrolase (TIGR01549 family)
MADRPFDAILFDLGSTLIYFDAQWPEILPQSYKELLRRLQAAGLELDDETFASRFSTRLDEYYTQRETEFIELTTAYILTDLLHELGHTNVPEPLIRQALAEMYAITQAYWLPESDAVYILEALRSRGYRLGLISNAGDDADVQLLVDKAGLRPYFEVILTSAGEGIRKPNPRIFHKALHQLRVAPERAAMVGDTLGADILGAQNAGMTGIWITRRADAPANRNHLHTIRPDAAIETLEDLIPLLDNFERE